MNRVENFIKKEHCWEDKDIMYYAKINFRLLVLGDNNTCVYKNIFDKRIKLTHIFQYFIMLTLGICFKIESFVAYMFYDFLFCHIIAVYYY